MSTKPEPPATYLDLVTSRDKPLPQDWQEYITTHPIQFNVEATMPDWLDYLNLNYTWSDRIGMNADKITPKLIEQVLRTDGYIERRDT